MTKITLLNWQREALKLWIENKGKGVVQAPTGSGKTYLALKLMQSDKLYPFLVVVPSVELKQQWIQRIRKYYPERGIIGIGGGDKIRNFRVDITVAIINSIRRERFNVKTLIVDEVHHSTVLAPINYGIWNNIQTRYTLGLSATAIPEQLSKENTGWDIPIVFNYTLPDCYRDGVLLKPEILTKAVQLEEQEQSDYDVLTEKIVSKSGSFGSFISAPVWFKSWVFDRNEILFNSKRKLSELRSILVDSEFKKGIIFVERIDVLNDVLNEVRSLNIDCVSIHSKMKKKERNDAVNRFINASEPTILANVHVFEEGMSMPQIDLLVLYSYNSTKRQSIQRIGRALHNKDIIPKIYILYYQNTKEVRVMRKIQRLFE